MECEGPKVTKSSEQGEKPVTPACRGSKINRCEPGIMRLRWQQSPSLEEWNQNCWDTILDVLNVPIKGATCIPATPATLKIFVKVFRGTENLQDKIANEFGRCCCIFYLHRCSPVSLLIQHGTVKPDHGAAGWDLGQNQEGVEPRLRRSCRAHRQLLS